MKKPKVLTENMYLLLCHCGDEGHWDVMVCGLFCDRKDAKEFNEDIEKCVAKHTIRKVKVKIEL